MDELTQTRKRTALCTIHRKETETQTVPNSEPKRRKIIYDPEKKKEHEAS